MNDDRDFELVESFVYGVLSGNVKLYLTYGSGNLKVDCIYSAEDPVYTKYNGGKSMERDPKRMKTSASGVKRRKTLASGPASAEFIFSRTED
jgi:tRNA A37 threonylcarbamoyladenosine dehydratase